MLSKRIIPCLDVRDGRVVKGVRFQGLRDSGDPADLAARYESEGADEITLLDISATPSGRASAVQTVARVREVLSIPLTVGGGVRSAEDAAALLSTGADKIGINTAAVRDPDLIRACADRFGAQCVVLAIDAARVVSSARWRVVVRSGTTSTDLDAVEWARQAAALGAGEILLTSWDRDGTRAGYDIELLHAVSSAVGVPVIASGGAAGPADLLSAFRAGADAALAAGIFHDGLFTVATVKNYLARRGVEIRA